MKIKPSAPLRTPGLLTLGLTAAILTHHAPAAILMIPELSGQMSSMSGVFSAGSGGGGGSSRVGGGDFGSGTYVPQSAPSAPSTTNIRQTSRSDSSGSSVRSRSSRSSTGSSKRRTGNQGAGTPATPDSGFGNTSPSVDTAPLETAPLTGPANIWELTVKGGWSSDYFFRGQNVFDRVSPDTTHSGLSTVGMDLVWNDAPGPGKITIGAAYQQSVDSLLPNGAALEVPPNDFRNFDNERFRVPSEERYQELNFSLGYTLDLIPSLPNTLGVNIGVNHYRFLDGRFWQKAAGGSGVDDTTESELKLFYLPRLGNSEEPLLKSTLGWWHDFDGFGGDFFELGLEKTLPLKWLNRSETRGLQSVTPFVNLGYDMEFNGTNSGWNHLETGVRLPFKLGENLFLNVRAAYNHSLDGSDEPRSDDGFAASVSFSSFLGGPLAIASTDVANLGKDALVAVPELTPWAFSGGVGWRNWDVSFKHRPVNYYDVGRLYQPQTGGGDLGSADGRDARYLNGAVYGSQKNNVGTAAIEGGEGLGSRDTSGEVAVGNRQVRFDSKRYKQSRADRQENSDGTDDDQIMSPYLKLGRELGRSGPFVFDLAIIYAFTDGQFDSGTRLSSVSSAFETSRNYGFIYSLDEVNSTSGRVIVNPDQYNAEYKFEEGLPGQPGSPGFKNNIRPQRTEDSFITEKARVASFTKSSLSLQMHELALPIGFTVDLGTRWHIGLSVGPTLNLVNTKMDTDIYYQQLDVELKSETLVRNLNFNTTQFGAQVDDADDNGGVISSQPIPGSDQIKQSSNTSNSSSQPASQPVIAAKPRVAGGGKGALNVPGPRLPGTNLSHHRKRDRDQDFTWGITGQATVTFDIDARDRWFLEAWGRYQWLDDLEASNDFGTAEIDPSSFSVGLGLGYRF